MTTSNTYKTNTQEVHRPAPSSPNEVITILKGMTDHEHKEQAEDFANNKGADQTARIIS